MTERPSFRKPLLASLATVFAVVAIAYGSLWMYAVRHQGPRVELGFNNHHNPQYDETTHCQAVEDVMPESPAERAGLRVGDHVIGINGRPLETDIASDQAYLHGHPGDSVEFDVERPGEPQPLILHGVFRAVATAGASESLARSSAQQITGSFPIPFLLVGFTVLFLRLEEPNAWLLALLFCAFAAAPSFFNSGIFSPPLRYFASTFRALFAGMLCPLFYLFFAVFPVQSPLDRRLPWLKWVGLLFGICIVIPGLRTGIATLPPVVAHLVGSRDANFISAALNYDLLILGLIALAQNSFMAAVPLEARRKSRVILLGTVAGVVPIVLEKMAADFLDYHPSYWVETALELVLFLYPLSFAYAVVKHRVMDIPALLRRSARYVLVQRGFIVLMFLVASVAIAVFTRVFSRFLHADTNVGMALSAVFGVVLVWTSSPLVKQGTMRIDRAFFRGAYDSRTILHDLAEKTRTVGDRSQLAMLIERHVSEALHPKTLACYVETGNGRLSAISGISPAPLTTLSASAPLFVELASRGKAWEAPFDSAAEQLAALAPLAPECLVPILGRDNNLIGLLVLGQRLSEEPYSGEDKRLLESVAAQAGIALENIRLAEKMAERMEADRRAAQEMDIARQVQARLFPQKLPAMQTLEYTGACIQARKVGGDYYDFLELRPGRLALVLADIAGKGVSGALLMANLQANLRSQYALAVDDLPRLLTSVNRLFFENSGDASYATLFFADYDDSTRKLRYANCGHLSPLLLRASSSPQGETPKAEWLSSTCTVMGLFEAWHCEIAEVQLAPGDMLVLYTDGVTEAENADEEEFGASRLLDTLASHSHLPVEPLLQTVVAAVQQFASGSDQQDDITLVIARCLA